MEIEREKKKMEEKKFILILDIGSTSIRSTIFDKNLDSVGFEQKSLDGCYEVFN